MHLNLCFAEPLLERAARPLPELRAQPFGLEKDFVPPPEELHQFLAAAQAPLVILGPLEARHRPAVGEFLQALGAPVYAEASSGLREKPELAKLLLRSGERILAYGAFDSVLRIGGVPTLRYWRDLEDKNIAVLSLDEKPFRGLGRGKILPVTLETFLPKALAGLDPRPGAERLFELDRDFLQRRLQLFSQHPTAEPALVHALSRIIPKSSRIFLGNSLPIREWDLAADTSPRGFEVAANRGANGIDGEVSTFLGFARAEASNWALIGDCTALYDLAAPWVVPSWPKRRSTLWSSTTGAAAFFRDCRAWPNTWPPKRGA